MKRSLSYILAAILAVQQVEGCLRDNGDAFIFREFGLSETEVVFPSADSLSRTLHIWSNTGCLLTFVDEDHPWLRLVDPANGRPCVQFVTTGDASFQLECDQNDDYARMVRLFATTLDGSRSDTLFVKQRGKRIPTITLSALTLLVDGSAAGEGSVAFTTNIDDLSGISVEVEYPEEETTPWLGQPIVGDGVVRLPYAANGASDQLRFANVHLRYVDGTGETFGPTLYVIQKTSEDGVGSTMSFEDVRDMNHVPGLAVNITDNVLVKGFVVSDPASGNVGENPKTASNRADYTACRKNIYLESEDGAYGFLISTQTEADNIFKRYDKVTILLRGTTLYYDEEPDRYRIEGLSTSNIISRETGTAESLPVKERYIEDLTDSDIYTYVTLRDCEFSIRKGPLTPLNEGFTLGNNRGYITKYPRAVRDSHGRSLYLYTNTTCPYRRDGTLLPWGSGTLSGVVVHERMPAYVYGDGESEDEYGNIGRYQIRHMSAADVAFDTAASFSRTLVEFNCVAQLRLDASGYYIQPAVGEGRLRHSTGDKLSYPLSTMNYIGWVGQSAGVAPFVDHIGCDAALEKPLGYDFPVDADWYQTYVNTDGAGKVSRGVNEPWDGWRLLKWWNDATDRPYAWVIECATAGISATHIAMQFTAVGGVTGSVGKTPYYWKAQWSRTGNLEADADWTDIADFVVPDGTVSGSYREWQLPAMKQFEIPLPTDILGHDKVYIRLLPSDKVTNTLFFGEGVIEKGTDSGNTMDYFSIRYN